MAIILEMISLEELLMSNVIEQEALINLREKKAIITKTELLKEIKKLKEKGEGRGTPLNNSVDVC